MKKGILYNFENYFGAFRVKDIEKKNCFCGGGDILPGAVSVISNNLEGNFM